MFKSETRPKKQLALQDSQIIDAPAVLQRLLGGEFNSSQLNPKLNLREQKERDAQQRKLTDFSRRFAHGFNPESESVLKCAGRKVPNEVALPETKHSNRTELN